MRKRRSPYEEMNPEELVIWRKMLDYDEKYFADMRLESKGIIKKLKQAEFKDDDGKWKTYYEDSPFDQEIPGAEDWFIKIRNRFKEEWIFGCCNRRTKTVEILKGLSKCKLRLVLLHELIHVYEYIYKKYYFLKAYKEYLLLYLNKKQEKDNRIGTRVLEDFVNFDLHILTHQRDKHSLLFLLKSLDLDLRLKKALGTIYSYGRPEIFKDIKRRAEKRGDREIK